MKKISGLRFLVILWKALIAYAILIFIGSIVRLCSYECGLPNKFNVHQIFKDNKIEYKCVYCDYKLKSFNVDCKKYFDYIESERKEDERELLQIDLWRKEFNSKFQ